MSTKKREPDKKLDRFSTISQIITNLGIIAGWFFSLSSAFILYIQKFPVVVPGINFTLDSGFQFALVVCAMLAYIQFLRNYWDRNKEKLSSTFMDFSFWDLPRIKRPLLIIPVVISIPVFIQISAQSYILVSIFLLFLGLIVFFVYKKYTYYHSPDREYEKLLEIWEHDDEWFERWRKRISTKLNEWGNVAVADLYEFGYSSEIAENRIEIRFALRKYLDRYEFEEDLILVKNSDLPSGHPRHSYSSKVDLILLRRENLSIGNSY